MLRSVRRLTFALCADFFRAVLDVFVLWWACRLVTLELSSTTRVCAACSPPCLPLSTTTASSSTTSAPSRASPVDVQLIPRDPVQFDAIDCRKVKVVHILKENGES